MLSFYICHLNLASAGDGSVSRRILLSFTKLIRTGMVQHILELFTRLIHFLFNLLLFMIVHDHLLLLTMIHFHSDSLLLFGVDSFPLVFFGLYIRPLDYCSLLSYQNDQTSCLSHPAPSQLQTSSSLLGLLRVQRDFWVSPRLHPAFWISCLTRSFLDFPPLLQHLRG